MEQLYALESPCHSQRHGVHFVASRRVTIVVNVCHTYAVLSSYDILYASQRNLIVFVSRSNKRFWHAIANM